jgi:hypothetical protein
MPSPAFMQNRNTYVMMGKHAWPISGARHIKDSYVERGVERRVDSCVYWDGDSNATLCSYGPYQWQLSPPRALLFLLAVASQPAAACQFIS